MKGRSGIDLNGAGNKVMVCACLDRGAGKDGGRCRKIGGGLEEGVEAELGHVRILAIGCPAKVLCNLLDGMQELGWGAFDRDIADENGRWRSDGEGYGDLWRVRPDGLWGVDTEAWVVRGWSSLFRRIEDLDVGIHALGLEEVDEGETNLAFLGGKGDEGIPEVRDLLFQGEAEIGVGPPDEVAEAKG